MSFSYSVVIPYFNNADYIEETLQSIIANEFDITKIQVLLIDDGSTDNIKDIVNNVCDKYKTLHIEYHKKNNGNWGSVINYCKHQNLIKGQYFTILDSDDILNNQTFKKAEYLFKKHNSDAVIFDVGIYDSTLSNRLGKIHTYTFAWSRLLKHTNLFFSPIGIPLGKIYKTELLKSVPDILEKISFMDTPFFNYLMKQSSAVYYSKYVGGRYRTNTATSSMHALHSNTRKFQELLDAQVLLQKIVPSDAYSVQELAILDPFYLEMWKKIYPNKKIEIQKNLRFGFMGFWMRVMSRAKFRKVCKQNKELLSFK